MKKLSFIFFFLFCFQVTKAQKVYSVKYESQADFSVYVVKYENQADLKVFKVK